MLSIASPVHHYSPCAALTSNALGSGTQQFSVEHAASIGIDEEQLVEVLCRMSKPQQVYRTKHDQKVWDEAKS